MNTAPKSSMKSIQLRQPKKQCTWKQVKEIVLNPYEAGKINYTEDENYEAYKVFSIMDVDNSGCITIRELQRLLMGQFSKTMPLDFDHPDTGIVWGLGPRNNVVIQSIEKDSPASKHFDIIPGFKLKKINQIDITQENKVGLKELHKELIRSGHGHIHFEFFEPFFLISKFTVSLDIEVEGRVYCATLPVGAINEIRDFEEIFEACLRKAHRMLEVIRVRVDPATRQVRFFSDDLPFRLLFATGPNYQTSCRYAIGFWADDFDYSCFHTGQPLSIDLKMTLTENEMDILLVELFNTFDTDQSGEFRFEEFRNFYVQFLSSQEKLQRMKDYAAFRFRDKEEERRMLDIVEARRAKAKRRELLKEKNADKIIIHMKKVQEKSRIDGDGVKRRVYDRKREDQITMRQKKKNRGSGTAIVKYGANKNTGLEEEPSQDDITLAKERTLAIKKKQEIARKVKLNRTFTDIETRKKDTRAAMMDAKKRFFRLHMAEVVAAFKRCQEDANRSEAVENDKGLLSFAMTYEKMIQSPQLRFFDSFGVPDVEDIEMDEVPSTKLHPAGISYFFIKKRPGDDFNSRMTHPSFFGAEYERESSKASMVALGAARVMMKNMNAVSKKLIRKSGKSKKSLKALSPIARQDIDVIDWEELTDFDPPSKTSALKRKGERFVEVVESVASEVTNAVISWGTTLVVLSSMRENLNSTLLHQLSVTHNLDEKYKNISSGAEMLEKVALTAGMFDALGRLIRPAGPENTTHTEESMEDIEILFEKHNRARNEKLAEAEAVRLRKRQGRFGPDEIFRKNMFDQEMSDNASGRSTISGFHKRTVNAGFYLEKEVFQPIKKRRTGKADLNAVHDEEEGCEHDPGGVNTSNPLSVMLLNQLATSDPAFTAQVHTAKRPETVPSVDQGAVKAGKSESSGPPIHDTPEAWGVIGPAVGVELGSTSLVESGGSSAPVGGKPTGQNTLRFSALAGAPVSAISDEDDPSLAPIRFGRPATAYGLDKNIYESGQGIKYRGFTHVPIATSVEKPIEVGGMLNRLERGPTVDMSESEAETEAEAASRRSGASIADDESSKTDDASGVSSLILPAGTLRAHDSVSLSSETVVSDVKRYRQSLKKVREREQEDPENISLASQSLAPDQERETQDDEISFSSEITDPIQAHTFHGRAGPLKHDGRDRNSTDEDSVISLESSSVVVSCSYTNSQNSRFKPGTIDNDTGAQAGAEIKTEPVYQLRANKRKTEEDDSRASTDNDPDNLLAPDDELVEHSSDGSYDSDSDGASGDISEESSDGVEESVGSSSDSDVSSGGDDSMGDDDNELGDVSLHSIDELERIRALITNSVYSSNSASTPEDLEIDTIGRIRLMRMKMMEMEQKRQEDERHDMSAGQVEVPSVSLNSETTEMQSGDANDGKIGVGSYRGSGVLLPDSVSLQSQSVDPSNGESKEPLPMPDSVSLVSHSIADTSEGRSQLDDQFELLNSHSGQENVPRDSVSLASLSLVSEGASEPDIFDVIEPTASYHEIHADSVSLDSESQVSGHGFGLYPTGEDYMIDEINNMREDTISLDSESVMSGARNDVNLAIVRRNNNKINDSVSLPSFSEEMSYHAMDTDIVVAPSHPELDAGDFDDSVSEISDAGDSPEQCVARYAWAILIASTSRLFVKSVVDICLRTHQQHGSVYEIGGRGESFLLGDAIDDPTNTSIVANDSLVFGNENIIPNQSSLQTAKNKVVPVSIDAGTVLVTDTMPQILNVLPPIDIINQFADAAVSIYLGEAIYKLEKLGYRNKNGLIVYKGITDQLTRDQLQEIIRREKLELKRSRRENRRLKKTMERLKRREKKLAKEAEKAAKKRKKRRKIKHHISGRDSSMKRRQGVMSRLSGSRKSDRPDSSTQSKHSQSEKHARKEEKVPFKPIRASVSFTGLKIDAPPSLLQTTVMGNNQIVHEPRLLYLSGWTPRGSWTARTIPKAMVPSEVSDYNPDSPKKGKNDKDMNSAKVESLSSFLDQRDDSLKNLQQQHSSLVAGTYSFEGVPGLTQSIFQGLKIGELAFENSVVDPSNPGGRTGSSVLVLDTIPENQGSSNKLRKELSEVAEIVSLPEVESESPEPANVSNVIPVKNDEYEHVSRTYSEDFEVMSEGDSDSGGYEYLDLDEVSEKQPSSRSSLRRRRSENPSSDASVKHDDLSELSAENDLDNVSFDGSSAADRPLPSQKGGSSGRSKSEGSSKVVHGERKDDPTHTQVPDVMHSTRSTPVSISSSQEDIDEGRISGKDDVTIDDGSEEMYPGGVSLGSDSQSGIFGGQDDMSSRALGSTDNYNVSLESSQNESSNRHLSSSDQSAVSKGQNGYVSLSSGGGTGAFGNDFDAGSLDNSTLESGSQIEMRNVGRPPAGSIDNSSISSKSHGLRLENGENEPGPLFVMSSAPPRTRRNTNNTQNTSSSGINSNDGFVSIASASSAMITDMGGSQRMKLENEATEHGPVYVTSSVPPRSKRTTNNTQNTRNTGIDSNGEFVSLASAGSAMLTERDLVSLDSMSTASVLEATPIGLNSSTHSKYVESDSASATAEDQAEGSLPKIEMFVDAEDDDSMGPSAATIWWPELEAPRKATAVSFADDVPVGNINFPNKALESSVLLPQLSSFLENDKKSITSLQRELVLHKPKEWSAAIVRIYQEMKFEIRDGVTTDLVGEFSVGFSDLVSNLDEDHKCKKKLQLSIHVRRKGFEDITLRGTMECEVDASDPILLPPKHEEADHFLEYRPQHWTVFPNCPINIGIVRQKYKDIAKQYDRQRVVNPSMFGFRVRFCGHEKDESQFVHPMFTGYTFGRKPATKEQMEALHLQEVRELNPNPWRWQPGLEKLGLCPICTTGLKGCPRCFNMPVKDNGESSRPEDFQYDPEKDLAKRAAREAKITQKTAAIALKKRTRRFLIEAGVLSDHGSDEEQDSDSSGHNTDEEEEKLVKGELYLHTKLTTTEGLRLWRNIVQVRLTVWIKIMPGGEVRKFGVEADDTMWHLHNMFLSHSEYGNTKGGMLILPTYNGFFELDNIIELENEHVTSKDTGRILVRKYGMKQRNNTLALLFFPQYKRQYLPSLFKGFYNQNVENLLTKDLNVYPELYYLPEDLSQDLVQNDLKLIFDRHYLEQQLHHKAKIRQKEIDFAARLHQKGVDRRQRKLDAIKEEQKRLRQEERRVESQLKGLEGEERENMRRILMERLLERNQQIISDSAGGEARRRLAKRQTRLENMREKRMINKAAANSLHPVLEGEEDEYSSDEDYDYNDGMDASMRSEVTQESVGTLNTKGVQELSASQVSHVLATQLESTISIGGMSTDEYSSEISLSEASKNTFGGANPSVSIIIDPSKEISAQDLISLSGTSMSSSVKQDADVSHAMANSLAESLKHTINQPDEISLEDSSVGVNSGLDREVSEKLISSLVEPGDAVSSQRASDSNSKASSLRRKFRRARDTDQHETGSDVGSVVSDVSDRSDVKTKNILGKDTSRKESSRPNTSRGGDDGEDKKVVKSSLAGLDLSSAGPSLQDSFENLSDDGNSVKSLTSNSSFGSIKKKKPISGKNVGKSADASGGGDSPEHMGKLSRANSNSSLLSDDSSVGFHPSFGGESHESQSVKSTLSRALSKQESFVFKKFEITSIQDHNVKASMLGHARMQSSEQVDSTDESLIPSALKSSSVDQPGIQIKKKEFKRQDSYERIPASNKVVITPPEDDDDQSLKSAQSVDTGVSTLGPRTEKSFNTADIPKETAAIDAEISSSSDESRDSRIGKPKKKKKPSKVQATITPPSSDEENREGGKSDAVASSKTGKKKKKKKREKSEPEKSPEPDLHQHTRGISVKKPYSTGYSNKLLKPLSQSDKRVIEATQMNETFLRSTTPEKSSRKLDPVSDMAAKTYESTFLRFLNPAFRKSHKKT